MKCRGVRVHVQGKGYCHFTTSSGENTNHHTHTQFYTNCRRTFFGNVNKTPVIQEAGENAIFGPPWAPDEGILFVNLPMHNDIVILQAMDYEWLKRDKVLGEVYVDVKQCVGRGQMSINLMRNGSPESGVIVFQMDWDPSHANNTNQRCLRIQIFRTLGLRSSEWFGKNDVYVQVYALPEGKTIEVNKALPDPVVDVFIPPGEMVIPFSFQLPQDLPSSIVRGDEYIAYSIYANIDIAWKHDPSTRMFFTVMQPNPAYRYLSPVPSSVSRMLYPRCCIPPFCCCSFSLPCCNSLGTFSLRANTDRGAYAPGENIIMSINISSSYPGAVDRIRSCYVSMNQICKLWAEGYTQYNTYPVIDPISFHATQSQIIISVPPLPPTYEGGLGRNAGWLQEVSRYGGRWARTTQDPITWSYMLILTINMVLPGIDVNGLNFVLKFPIVISGLGLSICPPPPQVLMMMQQQQQQQPLMQQVGQILQGQNQQFQSGAVMSNMMLRGNAVVPEQFNSTVPIQQEQFNPNVQFQQAIQSSPQYQQQPETVQIQGYGHPQNQSATTTDAYGFSTSIEWQKDENVKEALPKLSLCQSGTSFGRIIRDPQEDYTVENNNDLMYQPTFFMSPAQPVHT